MSTEQPDLVCEAVAPFKSALVQCDKEPGHKGPHHAEYQGVTLRWGHRR